MVQSASLPYAHTVELATTFDEAVSRAKAALAAQGFGVLCEIDVSATLKEKLGVDRPRLTILGACNPTFANQALAAEPGVALFLPCNVVVGQSGDRVSVSAIDAKAMLGLVGNAELTALAAEVDERMRAVVETL